MKIEWRKIEGYYGYEVSNTGIVRGVDRYVALPNGKKRFAKGRIIKPRINNYGYLDVRLSQNGKSKTFFVHRLVALAFIENPDGLPQVNHLSGDKQDNRVENLAWTDASGNAKHAYQTGLNTQCGCSHTFAVAIINLITGDIFCTQKAVAEHLGANYSSIRNALNGHQPFPKALDLSGYSFAKYNC